MISRFFPLLLAILPILPAGFAVADTLPNPTITSNDAAVTPAPLSTPSAPGINRSNMPAPAFEQVLAHVYEENPQLQSERESVKILDERVSQANAAFRPSLQATTEIGEARVSENDQAWRYGEDKNLGLSAIQPIYNGASYSQRDSAKARVEAGRAHLLVVEQTVLMNVISSWLDMCEKAKLLDATRDSLSVNQHFVDATRQRFSGGDTTQTDVAVAESRAADAQTRYEMAQSAYELSRIAYQRASGLPPQIADYPLLPLDLPHSGDEAVDLAKNNPAMLQSGNELEATEDDIDAADNARLPYFYLRGSMSDEHAMDLGLARLRTDAITINASIPLYQGGLEYSKLREAKLAHAKSRLDMQNTSRGVIEEARDAWNNYRTAQSVVVASNQATQAASRATSSLEEEYKTGTRNLTELLDAQGQLLNAQMTNIQAQKNMHLEAFRLMAAVGRLTAKGLNLPTQVYDPAKHYDAVAARWYGTDIDEAP